MSNHQDRIASMIDKLLVTKRKETSAWNALLSLGGGLPYQASQVGDYYRRLVDSKQDQRQALLDAVTTDAEHAAQWRELVGMLNLDLDDTEVPDVFDAFEQDSEKGDGAEEGEPERPSSIRTDRPNGDEHPLILVHRFDSGGVRASYDPPALAAAVEAVMEVHRPVEVQAITGDCAREWCRHKSAEGCETALTTICAGCDEFAQSVYGYYAETDLSEAVWPCPTRRALNEAMEGRDNE